MIMISFFFFISVFISATLGDNFYSSSSLQEVCPKVKLDQTNGRENVIGADLFFLTTPSVYFSVQQEENPAQVSITYWKTTGQITQILSGVLICADARFDQINEMLLLLCSANVVHLFKFQTSQFVLHQIFQHHNTQLISDIQLMTHSAAGVQFATLCFNESELRFWTDGAVLPVRTVYLRLPNNTDIYPSAFNFIFIPYTKLIAVYDINKSVVRLMDIDLGEVYKTSTKYLPSTFPIMKNFIQYNHLWKLIVLYTHFSSKLPPFQMISTLFANDTTVYKQFNITYENEIGAYVTCMHVLQGTEFLALGHSNGNITIHNILTSKLVRNISISDSPIIDILQVTNFLNIITKDSSDEIIYYQYDWANRFYVETRQTNQAQCVASCENQQYEVTAYLACRSCNADYNCKTCDSNGCLTCNSGRYLDSVTLTNGTISKTCVVLCSNQQFGLAYDNSDDTECIEICPSDIYNVADRICSQNTQVQVTSESKGVTASLTADGATQSLQVQFSRDVSFNPNHILTSTQTKASYITDCVFLAVSSLKSSEFSYTATLSSTSSTILNIDIKFLVPGAISTPKVTVTFEGQTCFKDSNFVPLSQSLVADGLSGSLPWNLEKVDEKTKSSSKAVGAAATAAAAVVAAASIPLVLSNVMFVFWILVNVMQLVNFLLYLNVIYPVNIVNFFRAFSAFSFDWLPTFGLKSSSDATKSTFLGESIVDQVPADPFVRESLTSSFYLNGLKFLQTFIFLYIALFLIRIIARVMKIDCRRLPSEPTIVQRVKILLNKIVSTIQVKLEFTLIITTHQSSMLKFSLAIFLQLMKFSSANAMNVIGFLIAIIGLIYLILYLRNCYQKVNLNEMVVGSKIQDRVIDTKMKEKYEKYKQQYGVLFMDINFIFYGRRNYHVFSMIKQALIPFVVVCFNTYTFACILTLLALYILNAIFLILYRPFDRKAIGYLSSVNEICMAIILCLVFYIHYVNESAGATISASDLLKNINIGWAVISVLIVLFAFNIVSGIVLEWQSIKEAINLLRQKVKDFTKKGSAELKDDENEKVGLKSKESPPNFDNILSVKNFNESAKQNKVIKESFKSKNSMGDEESDKRPRDIVNKMRKLADNQKSVDVSSLSNQQSGFVDLNQSALDSQQNEDSEYNIVQTRASKRKQKKKKGNPQALPSIPISQKSSGEAQVEIQMEEFSSDQ